MESKPATVTWRWVARDPRTGRWRELTWAMTEEDAAKGAANNGGTQIARIVGTTEIRADVDGRRGAMR